MRGHFQFLLGVQTSKAALKADTQGSSRTYTGNELSQPTFEFTRLLPGLISQSWSQTHRWTRYGPKASSRPRVTTCTTSVTYSGSLSCGAMEGPTWTATPYLWSLCLVIWYIMKIGYYDQDWTKWHNMLFDIIFEHITVQGDTSDSSKPHVDINTKLAFQYKLLILKRNFCFDVNRRFGTTWCVTL